MQEKWSIDIPNKGLLNLDMEVTYGKPVDIFGLKRKTQKDFLALIKNRRDKVTAIFNDREISKLTCPICDGIAEDEPAIVVYGGVYLRCSECSHLFVGNPLNKKEIVKFYKDSKEYSAIYTDKDTSNLRVEQVALPKAKWVLEEFKRKTGRLPKKVLDVGAGGGHIVEAFIRLGIPTDGIELSTSSIDFAKQAFGINLIDKDFLTLDRDYFEKSIPEVICFWGVLEHVTDPIGFLNKTREIFGNNKDAMVVSSVPNFRSGSTVILENYPDYSYRHLGPESHLSMFVQKSIVLAYKKTGFIPEASWFFGMDAYEFWTQIVTCNRVNKLKTNKDDFLKMIETSLERNNIGGNTFDKIKNLVESIIENVDDPNIGQKVVELQASFDAEKASDEIVLVGRPEI